VISEFPLIGIVKPTEAIIVNEMIIATKDVLLDETFGFSSDVSLSVFISEFQKHVVICRNCGIDTFCSVKDYGNGCRLSEKLVENFIKTHILRIDYSNNTEVDDFCHCLYEFLDVVEKVKLMIGTLADDSLVDFFLGGQPDITIKYGHRLIQDLGAMFDYYRVVNHKEIKKIILLVEGVSEQIFIPGLLSAMGVDGVKQKWIQEIVVINLEGKDKIQKTKIKEILQRFRESGASYFLIIDNDEHVSKYLEDLERERLLDKNYYILWENAFEDNFSVEIVFSLLQKINSDFSILTVEEIQKKNSEKTDIKKTLEYLMKEKKKSIDFNKYKVELAKKLLQHYSSIIETNHGKTDEEIFQNDAAFLILIKKIRLLESRLRNETKKFLIAM